MDVERDRKATWEELEAEVLTLRTKIADLERQIKELLKKYVNSWCWRSLAAVSR